MLRRLDRGAREGKLEVHVRALGLASRVAVVLVLVGLLLMVGVAAPAWASELPFGWAENGFTAAATNENGTPDIQAGSHPFAFTTNVLVNTTTGVGELGRQTVFSSGGDVKDIEVNLPPGLVGDPGATPLCPPSLFNKFGIGIGTSCPADSQIGIVKLDLSGLRTEGPVYNLEAPRGNPAQFGFTVLGFPVVLIPRVRTGSDYGVSVFFTSIPQGYSLISGDLTLWGVPASPAHNSQRGECLERGGSCPATVPLKPFLSLPTSCTGPLRFIARVDSYEAPGVYKTDETTMPGMTGCDKLDFSPQVVVEPEPAQASSPSGLSVEVQVPQSYENPEGLAEANLKNTTVTLPAGVAVNPSAADGLGACSEEQVGLHDASEQTCPEASKIGQVEITTPLLPHQLVGGIYLAQQGNLAGNGSNPFGSLLALYIVVKDPYSGVLVKLAGEVKPDVATGQLVTTFLHNPQVPFDTLKLSFFGGPRAALVNPPLCGTYTTSTEMTPWSGGASATPASGFQIAAGPGGAPCVSSQPFAPGLVSGTQSNQAGGFSPFSLTFFRSDGEQNMSRLQVSTPPGLLGTLADVALCGEPQAAQGTCGPESLIGSVTVGVGAGSNPFYVTGKVYLTASYNGAPFGLAFVVPAVAGPLNLGVVVVRAAVNVDPYTAALTVTSEPLPQILQGVPLHIRAVNVTLDRERFIFNGTSCDPMSIQATMVSALGASSAVSTHYQATNCAALGFHPQFSVTTSGKTSRADGASLDARLVEPNVGGQPILATNGGQANIARVKVELPRALPSRLTTLQKACTAATFEADPAACPAASLVGYAKATTPLLPVQLTGPAYFVSHGGEAFPSLIVVLEGYGVRVNLVGSTFISKQGITSSTFAAVPDVPVSSFELYLPEGPYSALTAYGNLCTKKLVMPTEMVAQNGTVIHQKTPIALTGCAKTKTKKKAKKAGRASGVRNARDGTTRNTGHASDRHDNRRSM
ncbi:MAG TPA: hypothetical protein VNV42_14905 [Solirubrobacteraceae bacterium]|jgi:hypothetical protein|nr:hypothetical protein [Solirubrobacteraceae bacterium]